MSCYLLSITVELPRHEIQTPQEAREQAAFAREQLERWFPDADISVTPGSLRFFPLRDSVVTPFDRERR